MGWIVAAVMLGIVLVMAALYKRSLNDTNRLFSLTVLILLDESVYEKQRDGLASFIRGTSANNAMTLSNQVFSSMVD